MSDVKPSTFLPLTATTKRVAESKRTEKQRTQRKVIRQTEARPGTRKMSRRTSTLLTTFLHEIPVLLLLATAVQPTTARYTWRLEGTTCGRGKLWMLVNDQMDCTDCDIDQYYDYGDGYKKCMDCSESYTNNERNIRSSCKDKRLEDSASTPLLEIALNAGVERLDIKDGSLNVSTKKEESDDRIKTGYINPTSSLEDASPDSLDAKPNDEETDDRSTDPESDDQTFNIEVTMKTNVEDPPSIKEESYDSLSMVMLVIIILVVVMGAMAILGCMWEKLGGLSDCYTNRLGSAVTVKNSTYTFEAS